MLCRTLAVLLVPLADGWRPTSEGYVDSAQRPIRCHWEYAADESRCATVLQYAAQAWDVQVDELGFDPPIADDDGRVDIYISDDDTDGGAYAYGPSVDEVPGDGKSGCHAYMVIDPGLADEDLPAYTVHEFNHVLQYAMDFREPTLPIWEGTAHASEAYTIEGHTVDVSDVADFQRTPWVGLLADGWLLWDDYEIWSYYEYGAALWIQWLDHEYGEGRGTVAADLWHETVQEIDENEPDVLDAFGAIAGAQPTALMRFSVARTRIGTADAPPWASAFGPETRVAFVGAVDWTRLPQTLPGGSVFQTGVAYWRVTGVPDGETLEIEVEGPDVDWGVLAVEGPADDWAAAPALSWTGFGGEVVVGAVNLGPPGFDGDDPWRLTDVSVTLRRAGDPDPDPVDSDSDDDGGTDTDPGEDPEADGAGDEGCGCVTDRDAAPPWWLLFTAWPALARRGRAPRSSPRSRARSRRSP